VISRLLLLGATGDLAGRFLLPALAWRWSAGELPDDLAVVGGGAEDWDDATFGDHVAERWDAHARALTAGLREGLREGLLPRLRYRRFDAGDPATVAAAVAAFDGAGPVAAYLALPPALFPPTLAALGTARLPAGSRVAVEKPFGADLRTAVALNAQLAEVGGGEEAVTRVDHFLGMPAVAGLLALRSAGTPLAAAWHGRSLARVDVVWEEVLGLEGRAEFYDSTGAFRDVLQNHLFQVLVLLALELPPTGDDAALRTAKLELLRSLRPFSPTDLAACTRRARYTAGTLVGRAGAPDREVPDYTAEPGVDPDRGTETCAEITLRADTPRWTGTTFRLRTGKALGAPRKGIALHFRGPAPDCDPRDAERVAEDQLWIPLEQPARSDPGGGPQELTAYRRVLADVLSGSSATSVGGPAAEQAWRVVDPVLAAWATRAVPLLEYPAGSAGPPPLAG